MGHPAAIRPSSAFTTVDFDRPGKQAGFLMIPHSPHEDAWGVTRVPVAVIANTIKGKGVAFMEDDNNWHYRIPDAAEVEMDDDDTIDPLPSAIDLVSVMMEALTLALPAFPRAADASLESTVFTEPGAAPMTDEDAKPFAGLGALRDSLGKKDD